MSRAGSRAFSGVIRFAVIAVASGIVCQASGCGGQVFDGELDDSGATTAGGNSGTGAGSSGSKSGGVGGGGTAGAGPTGGRPGSGAASPSGGRAGTGGVPSTGGRAVTGGVPSTGGRPATGGRPSGGSVPGAGGGPTMDPATLCYAQGGVYFPDGGGCFLGSETNGACVRQAQPITRSCENKCACRACPSFYSRCLNDGGCRFIVACAQMEQCRGVDACMATPCSFIIDRAGGRSSIGARYFDQYSNCLSDSGCSCDLL